MFLRRKKIVKSQDFPCFYFEMWQEPICLYEIFYNCCLFQKLYLPEEARLVLLKYALFFPIFANFTFKKN
jgi:hypothetical protein